MSPKPIPPTIAAAWRTIRSGFSPAIWKQFAELGWLALPIEEAYGGLGGGAIEIGILMEAFGRGLVSEPYLATVVLGAGLIAECGSAAQKQAILPKVADGSLCLALAHSERAARFDLGHVETTATKTADGWRLAGNKIAVLDGHAAGQIIVSARVANVNGTSGKLGLFLVPSGTPGLTLRDYSRLGGGRGLQSRSRRCSPSGRCLARRRRRCPACDRSRGRPRDGRARRGGGRHHADTAGHDAANTPKSESSSGGRCRPTR